MGLFFSNEYDELAIINSYSSEEIVKNLTLENVINFLESLGVEEIDRQEDYLVSPTICHNPLDEAESMKLYYYDKDKHFHCYTECSENFNIIELYRRYMAINHYEVTYFEAEDYIRQFVTDTDLEIETYHKKEKEEKTEKIDFIDLPEYKPYVMDCFIPYRHPLWLRDGISGESMDKFNIRFSLSQNKIIIPHYDVNGRLVGIRGRALNDWEIENVGKYTPIKIEQTWYKHPLSMNLYGLNVTKENIRRQGVCFLVESEKAVMQMDNFNIPNCSVAICGSNFNKYQLNILSILS